MTSNAPSVLLTPTQRGCSRSMRLPPGWASSRHGSPRPRERTASRMSVWAVIGGFAGRTSKRGWKSGGKAHDLAVDAFS
jgi:hypothetical protein